MKRFTLALAAVLAIGLGVATAQNVTKSLQQSQDPTGLVGMDNAGNVYFPAHIVNKGSAPSISAGCGTGATVVGNDSFGLVTGGTTNRSQCIIAFRTAYTGQSVYCNIASNSSTAASPLSWTSSAAGFSVNHAQSATTMPFNYICNGAPS